MMEHNIFMLEDSNDDRNDDNDSTSHCVRCRTLLTTSRVVSRLLTRSGVNRRGLDMLHGSGAVARMYIGATLAKWHCHGGPHCACG